MTAIETGTRKRYAVVFDGDQSGWSAYVPDLPICFGTAKTRQELEAKLPSLIAFHIDGLREDGLPIPEPTTPLDPMQDMRYVEVAIPKATAAAE